MRGLRHLGDRLDGAALAGRVAALEDDHDLQPFDLDPFLEFDKLDLQARQLALVILQLHLQLWLGRLFRVRRSVLGPVHRYRTFVRLAFLLRLDVRDFIRSNLTLLCGRLPSFLFAL